MTIEDLKIIDKEGNELNYEIISLFNNPAFNAMYVAYTDGFKTKGAMNLRVEKGEIIDKNKIMLSKITDKKEQDFVNQMIRSGMLF